MNGPLKVALLGCGTVGSAVLRLLQDQSGDLAARIGRPVEVAGVAVRRPAHHPDVPAHLLTTDAHGLVTRDDVDLVVEVIGGIEPARSLMLAAFEAGKSVVSANKALLADDGVALHAAASKAGVDLYYEAAVAGAIPLLRPLRESLAGDQLRRVVGIVNGTTNYILSRMAETGAGFGEALAEATELGYAEADPTADVDGFDAAAKAAILASLAFHTPVSAADVYREGISTVTATDVARAAEIGCTVKLLAICERVTGSAEGDAALDSVAVRVHPAMIPTAHPLAAVGGAFNAVFVEAEAAGQLMFYGQGAGGEPTASAVLGDLVAVARNRITGGPGPGVTGYANLGVRPMAETHTRYHVSLDVADKPGVLAAVAQEFARQDVSISTVRQTGRGDAATLVIVTHSAPDAALSATIGALRDMPAVRGVTSVLRVEGLS
ncbi:MAG TPA: homoserine dehydrogenase [Blastococcus sp.]|nr:homoserine dehydrogenase [Blastococcus sp.]